MSPAKCGAHGGHEEPVRQRGNVIDELQLFTTKPSGCDHEKLSEIVGGAAAVFSAG